MAMPLTDEVMSTSRTRRRAAVVIALCVLCGFVAPASAQYFGQNKVHYRSFDFQVLRTENFDIYFYPSERPGIDIAGRMAERWRVRLGQLLRHELSGRQPLVLYASHTDFEQTNVIGGQIGEGTGGVTESQRRRIILPLAGPLADTDHVIGHELVHAYQFDMTTDPDTPAGRSGAQYLPLWFVEGMAEYLSVGPVDSNTAMWIRDAARQEKLPQIGELDNPKYFPYRWGQALWAYIGGRFGDGIIPDLFTTAAATRDIDVAFERVLGVGTKELSADWHAAIQRTYAGVLESADRGAAIGRLVIGSGKELGAELNVGPSMSPDGKWIAFLSTRTLFSTDLYLAETSSGRIVRRLTSTATDPHVSSIQFIHSSGAWDSASRQIAVATVANGRAALAFFDAQSGRKTREISIPDVDEILNPTWSPDGKAICFTGMQAGLIDLFVYDLSSGTLRRLTKDPFAEVQPVWSPDGRRIAFATDRFTSDLETLSIGPYRLALIDPTTGAIEAVPGLERAKQFNPQWSPDSQALYFISDRGGVADVYRVDLGSQTGVTQITAVGTGVSGITATSPAMSVSSRTGIVAYSVYQDGKYDIFVRDTPSGQSPRAVQADAAVLPPLDRKASDVTQLLMTPAVSLPEPAPDQVEPYRAKLALEGVSQPVVGVGVSRFGTSFSGGLALSFTDMLRNHQLLTAFQVNSGLGGSTSVKDIGAQVAYYNQAQRWNWGVVGGQIPYLSSGYQAFISQRPSGDVIQTEQLVVFRQTERSASGVVAYPFNRAQRLELQGGVSQISFDQIVTTTSYSLITGAVFEDSTETTSLGDPLSLGTASAAFVNDTSVFGPISPVQGQRSRFEVSPTFGTLEFTGVLADYRRYFMPARFYTLGVRVMHYGRYGRDSNDPRIYPVYVGYPWLVRGYDPASVEASECVPSETSDCPAIDRLSGTRMLVGNIELRFPLLRPFGVTSGMYGPIPVEVAVFADGGTAWVSGERPEIFRGSREGVSSAGVALRVNIFGYVVGEFDVVRPFQRPGRGWIFAFNLMPGW